jgi:hypothetical protein
MRIESAVPGAWWVDMRGENELSGADRGALISIEDESNGLAAGIWFGDDGDEYELAPDGVSMVKRPARRKVSRELITKQQTAMLARLITGWTWEDKLPMPYHTGYIDSPELPLEAAEKIMAAYDAVLERLRNGGPKETPGTTATSTSTSPESSTPPQPDSAPTTAAPASGSPATAA